MVGKNSDPQTGWIGGGSLRQTGYSFQVDKFQQLSTNQGLIVFCQMWACLSSVRIPDYQGSAFQG